MKGESGGVVVLLEKEKMTGEKRPKAQSWVKNPLPWAAAERENQLIPTGGGWDCGSQTQLELGVVLQWV